MKIQTTIFEKVKQSVSVFTMIPVLAISGIGTTTQTISVLSIPFIQQSSTTSPIVTTSTEINVTFPEIFNFKEEVKNQLNETRAQKINNYFARHNLPLNGYGDVFVEVADKYNLDWKLLPAIAMRESTGGKFPCPYGSKNVFGWHSCKTFFNTYEEAIDKVGQHLAGEVKSTAGYYKDKTIPQKLKRYNSVIPDYTDDIYRIMATIDSQKANTELALK